MFKRVLMFSASLVASLGVSAGAPSVLAQAPAADKPAPILWEAVDIPSRNVFLGPLTEGIR